LKKMIDEVTAAVQAADSRQSDAVIAKHAAIAYVNAKRLVPSDRRSREPACPTVGRQSGVTHGVSTCCPR
jgi:hypothetical protein